jgi:hypothetical protein
MSLVGLGPENVRADEGQQEFVNDRPTLVSKRAQQQNRNCPTVTKIRHWIQMGLDTKTDWPTDHRS